MFKKLQVLIANTLNVSERCIMRDTSIVDDLGADSLALVDLLMALEEEFDVAIPTEDALRLKTTDDILRYLESESALCLKTTDDILRYPESEGAVK